MLLCHYCVFPLSRLFSHAFLFVLFLSFTPLAFHCSSMFHMTLFSLIQRAVAEGYITLNLYIVRPQQFRSPFPSLSVRTRALIRISLTVVRNSLVIVSNSFRSRSGARVTTSPDQNFKPLSQTVVNSQLVSKSHESSPVYYLAQESRDLLLQLARASLSFHRFVFSYHA